MATGLQSFSTIKILSLLEFKLKVDKGNLEEIEASLKEKKETSNSSNQKTKKCAGSVFKIQT